MGQTIAPLAFRWRHPQTPAVYSVDCAPQTSHGRIRQSAPDPQNKPCAPAFETPAVSAYAGASITLLPA